jgi:hypothetical protein
LNLHGHQERRLAGFESLARPLTELSGNRLGLASFTSHFDIGDPLVRAILGSPLLHPSMVDRVT